MVCYIDVKANGGVLNPRFSVSSNEWRLAEQCHRSEAEVFILIRVFGIASEPQFGLMYVDPVTQAQVGQLVLAPKDGWWITTAEEGETDGNGEG